MSNFFAYPKNGVKVDPSVNCGCKDGNLCGANFTYVFDPTADTLTITDKSVLADGDSIVLTTGIQISAKDNTVPTANELTASGDATAPIVIAAVSGTLVLATDVIRVEYSITTVDGCEDTNVLFFNPNDPAQYEGAFDYYNAIR